MLGTKDRVNTTTWDGCVLLTNSMRIGSPMRERGTNDIVRLSGVSGFYCWPGMSSGSR